MFIVFEPKIGECTCSSALRNLGFGIVFNLARICWLLLLPSASVASRFRTAMQTRRGVRNSCILSDGLLDEAASPSSRKANGYATIPISSSTSLSSPSSFFPSSVNFIEHRISKMDTLAGVAIKYGVEVADIKRINGLVTDLQMFAHKSLQIPLPGKHPPSPLMLNGSTQNGEMTPPRHSHYDILNSLQSLKPKPSSRHISLAMCSLQGFYGLTQPNKAPLPEGAEMVIRKSGKTLLFEDKRISESPLSDPIHSRHRKSRSLVNVISVENDDITEDIIDPDRSIRRRQKADAEHSLYARILPKESNGEIFSTRTGKGLALRSKPGSRMNLEASRQNSSSVIDSLADVFVFVRKSSSTSNLTDSENSSSIWPTKATSIWSLKTDAITRPIFDGLPKPITAWRNKAALD